ncbi:MAG: hypothetical protein HY796_04300 [Elusimicrobia bacterium]|nr:hypothetical protein [Elusimicrobiota bacterium]
MNRRILWISVCAAPLALAGCHTRRISAPPIPAPGAPAAALPIPALHGPARTLRADSALRGASELLRRGRAAAAVREFHRCLVLEPGHPECLDGAGRSHAALRNWEDAALAWTELSLIRPDDRKLARRLAAARRSWKAHLERRARSATHVEIGTQSLPGAAPLSLRLVARFQRYNSTTTTAADMYDTDIDSPKSVNISTDGTKAYINSLEGARTVIYDARTFAKRGVIRHSFSPRQSALFTSTAPWFGYAFSEDLPPDGPNVFKGKPVESAFSHGGRFLWIPYYRRDFDLDGTQPSAAAIIDTASDAIVRIVPTGPITKNAAASPDGRFMALAHWGDDSVGLIDISPADPPAFSSAVVIALGPRAPPQSFLGVNRDLECGLCVRGLAWSADARTLLAGCMGGAGGVAVIDVSTPGSPALSGRVNLGGNPRDLVVSPDGRWLYVSASNAGAVIRAETARVIGAAVSIGPAVDLSTATALVGGAPRSMRLSHDGKWLFVALNAASQIAVVDAAGMTVAARVTVDSFPVGLDLSPDGGFLWVTSQGIDGAGGNSVEIFAVMTSTAPPRPSPGGHGRLAPIKPPPL